MRLISFLAIVATAATAIFATSAASAAPWEGPPGSYKRSCNNIGTNDGDLTARCRNDDDDYRYTKLDDYRDCEGDIWNDNGHLKCRREDNDGPWQGNGGNHNWGAITLYERSDYNGASRTFRDSIPNLASYSFADEATSVRPNGGRWQLCSRPQYQGRCVTVDYDVRDLRSLDMNDRISSIRRLRR